MYGFEPNDEQKMLVEAVERYAVNDLMPAAHDADEEGELPQKLIEKGWELGVLQASIPEEYGGFGEHSAVTGALAAEALGYGDIAAGMAVMAPASYAIPILIGGTEDQKKEWLPPVIEAEWKPYVAAFIEPDFDFAPSDMRTTAKKSGKSYVLNGNKTYVPYADKAEAYLVFAALDGQTQAFHIPAGTEGLKVGERELTLGLQALPTFRLTLEDVKIPADARVGGEDGFNPALAIASAQVATAAMGVGLSRAAYEYSLEYAKDREVWGVPIAQKQSIAFMLAEMAIEIESIRLMVWEAAYNLDAGKDSSTEAYLALVGSADMTMMVTDRAVQILGGHGYIREHPVERWMRNGRGLPVFPGMAMV